VSFSRLRHDPPGSYSTSCGRPSMFVLRSMRKHPEIFGDVSVNHSRTERKAIDNTQGRASRLSSSGVRSPDYSLSRRPQLAAIQPPLQKDDSTLRLAYSALELSPWQCRLTLWGTWTPGRADVARPGFSSIAAMYPVWPALLRRPLACALDSAQRRRRRWPDSKK